MVVIGKFFVNKVSFYGVEVGSLGNAKSAVFHEWGQTGVNVPEHVWHSLKCFCWTEMHFCVL